MGMNHLRTLRDFARNDTLPSVTGEDGLAVLKTAIELTSATCKEHYETTATKVAQEVGTRI